MVSDERIRRLCDRIVKSEGAEFQAALMELQEAIESRLGPEQSNSKSGEKK